MRLSNQQSQVFPKLLFYFSRIISREWLQREVLVTKQQVWVTATTKGLQLGCGRL